MQKSFSRNKEEKIRLIFETFANLVNRNGYDSLSTRHIAKAAGISVGTIYHYFPGGKHTIASRYIDLVTNELYDPNIFMKLEMDLQGFFEALIRKYVIEHQKHLEIHRAIDQAILADPDVYLRNQEATKINIGRVVAKLRDEGLYNSIPESVVQNSFILLFNVLEGLIHRHLFVYPLFDTDEELIAFLVKLIECVTKERGVF
jgi:AcrR family transcriptional regulator